MRVIKGSLLGAGGALVLLLVVLLVCAGLFALYTAITAALEGFGLHDPSWIAAIVVGAAFMGGAVGAMVSFAEHDRP